MLACDMTCPCRHLDIVSKLPDQGCLQLLVDIMCLVVFNSQQTLYVWLSSTPSRHCVFGCLQLLVDIVCLVVFNSQQTLCVWLSSTPSRHCVFGFLQLLVDIVCFKCNYIEIQKNLRHLLQMLMIKTIFLTVWYKCFTEIQPVNCIKPCDNFKQPVIKICLCDLQTQFSMNTFFENRVLINILLRYIICCMSLFSSSKYRLASLSPSKKNDFV